MAGLWFLPELNVFWREGDDPLSNVRAIEQYPRAIAVMNPEDVDEHLIFTTDQLSDGQLEVECHPSR